MKLLTLKTEHIGKKHQDTSSRHTQQVKWAAGQQVGRGKYGKALSVSEELHGRGKVGTGLQRIGST